MATERTNEEGQTVTLDYPGIRADLLGMAERADNAVEFHLNFQATFIPRAEWAEGHYEERRDGFRDHNHRCRAFAAEIEGREKGQ